MHALLCVEVKCFFSFEMFWLVEVTAILFCDTRLDANLGIGSCARFSLIHFSFASVGIYHLYLAIRK